MLHAAVARGIDDIVTHGDGSAKCFQPLPADAKLGSVQGEMDLVRYCAGAWPRDKHPYLAADPLAADYLAFAYSSERACRAAGETEAAEIWRFVRSVNKNAKKAQHGHLQKGGVSRVLLSARTIGRGPAHCTTDMLQFETPLDTLAFARSELWPVERGAGTDGWTTINKKIRTLRPMNCAWRGPHLGLKDVEGGLLGAGRTFWTGEDRSNANFSGANLRFADMADIVLTDADMSNTDLTDASLRGAYLKGTDFSGATTLRTDFTNASRSGGDGRIPGWRVDANLMDRV